MEFQVRPNNTSARRDSITLQPMEFQVHPNDAGAHRDTITLQPMEFQVRPNDAGARRDTIRLQPMEFPVRPNDAGARRDRGRERRLVSAPPPSEPDWRFSRIRLSSSWFTSFEDCVLSQRLLRVLATPARQSMHLARVCGPASSSLVLCDVVV